MAGLWADSPDYYNTAQLQRIWTSLTGTGGGSGCTVTSGLGRRTGQNTIQMANVTAVPAAFTSTALQKTLVPGSATIIHAFAIYFYDYSLMGLEQPFWGVGDATVFHVGLAMRADKTLIFTRGPNFGSSSLGTTIATAPTPISINTWYHFSIKVKIDDAVGTLSFKLNRVEQLNGGLGYTNLDTRNAGSVGWSRVCFFNGKCNSGEPAEPPAYRVTDQVICDDTGPRNNDHPGDCSVLAQLPNAGNGANVDWTPSAGTDHGTLVREAVADDDTSYNQGTAAGQRDTYIYAPLSIPLGTPKFLITRPCMKLTSAGSQLVMDVIRKGGTNYDGVNPQSPTSGTYAYYDFLRELDPQTGLPWTISGINASESGLLMP